MRVDQAEIAHVVNQLELLARSEDWGRCILSRLVLAALTSSAAHGPRELVAPDVGLSPGRPPKPQRWRLRLLLGKAVRFRELPTIQGKSGTCLTIGLRLVQRDAWLRIFQRSPSPSVRLETWLGRVPFSGYTTGMKTAVSIPDDVYEEAERLARRMKKSRSELYRRALAEYVARHARDHVTEAMDRVWAELVGQPDPFVSTAARRILERSDW